ncbi:MMPL family transporter [Nocardia sp. NPDC058058]|uniref:MMPL family transporter n=1 Tax=Nocardia sp. NPDC058058 TaxID=3346317 RepID=UPI0036DA2740
MSVYLYRWGKFAFRRKWIVLPVWLLLLVTLGVGGSMLSKPMSDKFSMPALPSERATDILDKQFPGMSGQFGIDAVGGTYVIKAGAGTKLTDKDNATAIDALISDIAQLSVDGRRLVTEKDAAALTNPIAVTKAMGCLSDADPAVCAGAPLNVLNQHAPATVAVLSVPFDIASAAEITDAQRRAAYEVAAPARAHGLTVEIGGAIEQKQGQPSGQAEMIGMGVALVVMVIAFGAIVAAFVPIVTAIAGLGAAMLVISLSTSIIEIPSFTTFLASMIGIALSIDYALFIVSRYKHELRVAESSEEAAGISVGTAGSAVVFAGLTVIVALGALSIVGVNFLTFMGLGGAVAAFFAVLTAITLMPALLGAFGRFLFTPKLPLVARHDPEDDTSVTIGTRVARLIGKRPWVALIIAVAALGALATPALGLQLGLPGENSFPADSTVRQAYDIRTAGFGEGSNGVLTVVADLEQVPAGERDAAVGALRDRLAGFAEMDYVTAPRLSANGLGVMLSGVPKSGPNNQATKDLVRAARDAEGALTERYGIEYGITGTTAIYADMDHVLLGKILPYLAIVAGAAFVLLILVFRSILVPLTAALGFLLSMAATFGATVLIFQEGTFGLISDPQPIISFLPIMLIGLVFGLAMDYQVFLVTRMREEYTHGKSPTDAMISGYHHGARVVTSAAIIMISVFGSFLLESDVTAKSMGFALACGVAIDAFVVRMVVVPALLVIMGHGAWWIPQWLNRILPDIDVEGAKLRVLQRPPAPLDPPVPVDVVYSEPVAPVVGPMIGGRIHRDDRHPVPAATLTMISQRGQQVSRTTADSDGNYTIESPAPGSYVLIVSADGHQPTAVNVIVRNDDAQLLDVTLAGSGEVSGVVRTIAHEPVPDATVSVTDSLGDVASTAVTAADGTYTCHGVPAGAYTVVAVAARMRPTATTLTVPDSGRLSFDLTLTPMAVLSGTVRAGDRTVGDARITVLDLSGAIVGTARTDENGRYAVSGLPDGEYTVMVRGYSMVTDQVTVTGFADHHLRLGFDDYARVQ